MIDIKFRAWDNMKNTWFGDYGADLYIELNGAINFGWNGEIMDDYYDRIILMQYTGKKDINIIDIYEDDIVRNEQDTYIVRFGEFTDDDVFQEQDPSQTGFYIANIHTGETFPFYNIAYEIIGNVYENKELLED